MIVPIDPRTVEPDYEVVKASLGAHFIARFGPPRLTHTGHGVATYGWWIDRDYVSLRVDHEGC